MNIGARTLLRSCTNSREECVQANHASGQRYRHHAILQCHGYSRGGRSQLSGRQGSVCFFVQRGTGLERQEHFDHQGNQEVCMSRGDTVEGDKVEMLHVVWTIRDVSELMFLLGLCV
jgi:hypothetical protein